ncbi:TM1812 family CRISPR-associated protein [Macellibacteroides fermentans]|uniref:TM1812 family CRISPR-associated protein n=1 Tax=Macellibacteroides fermentans TaxID=879969 RepID=UPI00406CA67F
MKKIVICGIPMKENVDQVIYSSEDKSIPAANRPVRYPINAFLEETLKPSDEVKVVLLVKKDEYGHHEKNIGFFKAELDQANSKIGAEVNYSIIDTDFSQNKSVHENLMGNLVDEFNIGAHVIVDSTYGPKDLPIVIFTALNFAEKFLDCKIDNIIYGQASFVNGHAVDTKLCDMIPLYYLGSITNTIHCVEPEKAKSMLKTLLSI